MVERKEVFHIGDRVRIVNPFVFIRCGYPLTKRMAEELITSEQEEAVREMFRKVGFPDHTQKNYWKVIDAITSELLRKHKWGGDERKIYTECYPRLYDKIGTVVGKKIVRTGIYIPETPRDNWGEWDYEPPHLGGIKTHIILAIRVDLLSAGIEYIEECDVVKIKEDMLKGPADFTISELISDTLTYVDREQRKISRRNRRKR